MLKSYRFDNGDEIPGVGLGTWKSAPGDVYGAVKEALRLGYRHLDCAAIYDNEAEVGRALAESFAEGIVNREEVWVTSKLWNDAHAPDDVGPALDRTLNDLRLDYLDLYLMHWPVAQRKDVTFPSRPTDFVSPDELPIETTWEAMAALVDAGKARHVGVSNFSTAKLQRLIDAGTRKPEMNQVELHPYLQQPSLLDFCKAHAIHVTAYSPLGSKDRPEGLKAEDEPILLEDPVVREISEETGASPAQVLIRWALERDTVVIPKSVNPNRMAENLAAAGLSLDENDLRRLADLDRHRRYVDGSFWAQPGGPHTLASLWDE